MADTIRYKKSQDNAVILTMDVPGQSVSTMNGIYCEAMTKTITQLEAGKEGIVGTVLTLTKEIFFAGGGPNELIKVTKIGAPVPYQDVFELKGQLRRLETLGKPVIAAINDAVLGDGREVCLACRHRIALDNPDAQLGLSEVTLGLLPGGGGVVRMVRLLSLGEILPYLTEGRKVCPAEVLKAGLIHELADSPKEMLEKAHAQVLVSPAAKQSWDSAGYKIPGGTPVNPNVAQMLAIAPSVLRDKAKGCFPTPEKTMCAAAEGAQVDFDTVQLIEVRYLAEPVTSQVAKNMIDTFWFQLSETNAGRSQPQGYPVRATKKVDVIDAGMMDAGIAYVSATAGIEAVLKDVLLEAAGRGKTYLARLLDKEVAYGYLSTKKHDVSLVRIVLSVSETDLKGYDLITEAVFGDHALKGKVTAETEKRALADAVVASNVSTLPITGLVQAVMRPEKSTGLHPLNPMDRVSLVEIIRGGKTNDEALARDFDYTLQIKRTPIAINDNHGFFTSRVFDTFTNEGIAILGEGVSAATINNQARQAGMSVRSLAIFGEVSSSLMTHIRNQTVRDLEAESKALPTHPAFAVIDLMVDEYKRPSKAADVGFCDYPANDRKHLWAELKNRFEKSDVQISAGDICDHLLFIQAIETMRCVEGGILYSVTDANIGSIFGIGFTTQSEDALQFINQYGLKNFTAHVQYLVEQYGGCFEPSALLLGRAAEGELS